MNHAPDDRSIARPNSVNTYYSNDNTNIIVIIIITIIILTPIVTVIILKTRNKIATIVVVILLVEIMRTINITKITIEINMMENYKLITITNEK